MSLPPQLEHRTAPVPQTSPLGVPPPPTLRCQPSFQSDPCSTRKQRCLVRRPLWPGCALLTPHLSPLHIIPPSDLWISVRPPRTICNYILYFIVLVIGIDNGVFLWVKLSVSSLSSQLAQKLRAATAPVLSAVIAQPYVCDCADSRGQINVCGLSEWMTVLETYSWNRARSFEWKGALVL